MRCCETLIVEGREKRYSSNETNTYKHMPRKSTLRRERKRKRQRRRETERDRERQRDKERAMMGKTTKISQHLNTERNTWMKDRLVMDDQENQKNIEMAFNAEGQRILRSRAR